MKKLLPLIIVFIFSIGSINAQILNFNRNFLHNDTVKWVGNVSVFFTAIDQEVSVANMGYDVNVIRKFKKHAVFAISKLHFASSDSETLLSEGFAHARMIFNRHNRLRQEIFIQTQYNAIRGLEDRNLIGVGFRYLAIEKPKYALIVGTSLLQEWENWTYNGEISSNRLIKSSNYILLFGEVNEHFHFNSIIYYQATFDDFFKPRVAIEINLNLNITKKLVFTSNITAFYDSNPVIPIQNFVYKFKNGLGYRF